MALNLASKYSDKVIERFSQKSLTEKGLNKDYDWSGVKTITAYSIPTVAMADYTRTGNSRYGTPTELQDTKQDMTITKDRAFTFTIDRGNNDEQLNIKEAGKCLSRQINEVVVPEVDTYRLAVWCAATNTQTTGTATTLTTANAYTFFLTAQEKLDNELVPQEGRICYATPKYINLLKLDPNFVKASDVAQNMLIKGQVGEVDGIPIIKVPATRMPLKTPFVLIKPSCSVSPMKLESYKIHKDPPGINGWLVEGRIIYDTFVFDTQGKAICKHLEV